VVEAITGKRLGDVLKERIFDPLGMATMSFTLTPAMRARLARMHQREANGSLTPLPEFELPEPAVHMGGHGLYGTVGDYIRFIRMWLNDGASPGGRVLPRRSRWPHKIIWVRSRSRVCRGSSQPSPTTLNSSPECPSRGR
jgi:methyl acetate hydrolase